MSIISLFCPDLTEGSKCNFTNFSLHMKINYLRLNLFIFKYFQPTLTIGFYIHVNLFDSPCVMPIANYWLISQLLAFVRKSLDWNVCLFDLTKQSKWKCSCTYEKFAELLTNIKLNITLNKM